MKWIIIDSVVNRAEKLQKKLSEEIQVAANHIRFLDEASMPEHETVYLVHHSDGYVEDFANMSEFLKDTFVIFYSGGGLSLSSLKSKGKTIGFFGGVFHNGDEKDFFLLLIKLKVFFDKNLEEREQEFESIFVCDTEEEILTDDIFNAIYEQQGEDMIEMAVNKRDKYIKKKGEN